MDTVTCIHFSSLHTVIIKIMQIQKNTFILHYGSISHTCSLVWLKMSEIRRSTRESVQVYANARNAISQNGVLKDLISSFLADYEVNGTLSGKICSK